MPPSTPTADFTPAYLRIVAYWKDDLTVDFDFRTSAGATVNMTGTWSAAIYNEETDTTVIVTPTVVDTGEATGDISMTVTTAQMATMFAGTTDTEWEGWYDLIRVDASSKRRTWVNGPFVVVRNRDIP